LPRRIRISEKDRDPKFFGDEIMVSKFGPVVGGNGPQKILVGQEHGHHVFCKFLGIFASCQSSHHQIVSFPFSDGDDGPRIVLAYDCIHLEISKSGAVRLNGALVYADPVRYMRASANRPSPMLETVTAVAV
jgi:hypothetical protein